MRYPRRNYYFKMETWEDLELTLSHGHTVYSYRQNNFLKKNLNAD